MSDARIYPLLSWRSALCDSELAPTTRHVGLTLSLYMSSRGGSAFPGATRLAKDTGLNIGTVREHLRLLLDNGWLTLIERGGLKGQKRIANHYQASIPAGFVAAPVGEDDPSATTTRCPDGTDPSSSPRAPVVLADPISAVSLHGTRGATPDGTLVLPAPSPDDVNRTVTAAADALAALREGRARELAGGGA